MKTFFKTFAAFYLVSFPLLVFFSGYRLGEKRVVVVAQADAPVVPLKQEKYIGDVAGSQSAQREEVVLEKEDNISDSEIPTTSVSQNEALWDEVNSYRQKHGLPAFVKDEVLCEFTKERLKELKDKGNLDNHEGFKGKTEQFFKEKGYHKIAENIAQGYSEAADIINKGWDTSTGHRALLQSPEFDQACVSLEAGFGVLIAGKK